MFLFLGAVAEGLRREVSAFCVCVCVCGCIECMVRVQQCTVQGWVRDECGRHPPHAAVPLFPPGSPGQEEEALVWAILGPSQCEAVLAFSLAGHRRRRTNRKTGPTGPRAWP